MPKNSDSEWEKWGRDDPYFGVITLDKYRKVSITDEDKAEFFESGHEHVDSVVSTIKAHFESEFKFERILDFGCGVGRLVVPFSKISKETVGVDVSESMLKEASVNCEQYSCNNVSLIKSDDRLSNLSGKFDLIHSFIVMQHIPIERGYNFLDRMLELVSDRGFCALHFTYGKAGCEAFLRHRGADIEVGKIKDNRTLLKKAFRFLKRLINKPGDPEMQMNSYDLNHLFMQVQSRGIIDIYSQYTNHQGSLGVFLFFRNNV